MPKKTSFSPHEAVCDANLCFKRFQKSHPGHPTHGHAGKPKPDQCGIPMPWLIYCFYSFIFIPISQQDYQLDDPKYRAVIQMFVEYALTKTSKKLWFLKETSWVLKVHPLRRYSQPARSIRMTRRIASPLAALPG